MGDGYGAAYDMHDEPSDAAWAAAAGSAATSRPSISGPGTHNPLSQRFMRRRPVSNTNGRYGSAASASSSKMRDLTLSSSPTVVGKPVPSPQTSPYAQRVPGTAPRRGHDGAAGGGRDGRHTAPVRLMQYVLPKALLRMSLSPAYADPARLTAGTLDRYYDLMLAPGVRSAMLARMEQTILVPPEPLLATITAPTLLLWGEKDGMIPITNASDYLKAMPNAQLAQLPALGHVPHEEAPTEALAPVLAFLGR